MHTMLAIFILLFPSYYCHVFGLEDSKIANIEMCRDESHCESLIPNNVFQRISIDCAANETLPGGWNKGACKRGAKRGLWSILSNGTNSFYNNVDMCNGTLSPPGQLSCENRRSTWTASNVVLSPTLVTNSTNLVVFLPGTGQSPNSYSRLLRSAQSAGHYVIGLSYLSQPVAVSQNNAWCTDRMILSAGDCHEELHELMLFGKAPKSLQGASKDMWPVTINQSVISLLISSFGGGWMNGMVI